MHIQVAQMCCGLVSCARILLHFGLIVLVAGLPMLTLVGEKMGGRVAAGLLQALGVRSTMTRTEVLVRLPMSVPC